MPADDDDTIVELLRRLRPSRRSLALSNERRVMRQLGLSAAGARLLRRQAARMDLDRWRGADLHVRTVDGECRAIEPRAMTPRKLARVIDDRPIDRSADRLIEGSADPAIDRSP